MLEIMMTTSSLLLQTSSEQPFSVLPVPPSIKRFALNALGALLHHLALWTDQCTLRILRDPFLDLFVGILPVLDAVSRVVIVALPLPPC
jgi:hypothetical protein